MILTFSPARFNSIAAVIPVGPAPTIRTNGFVIIHPPYERSFISIGCMKRCRDAEKVLYLTLENWRGSIENLTGKLGRPKADRQDAVSPRILHWQYYCVMIVLPQFVERRR